LDIDNAHNDLQKFFFAKINFFFDFSNFFFTFFEKNKEKKSNLFGCFFFLLVYDKFLINLSFFSLNSKDICS
jgi:hypothetical protein